MGKKQLDQIKDKETAKVEAVLQLIRKQTPLTVKQVFFFFFISLLSAYYNNNPLYVINFIFVLCIGKVL
jgi:hypothetical protein